MELWDGYGVPGDIRKNSRSTLLSNGFWVEYVPCEYPFVLYVVFDEGYRFQKQTAEKSREMQEQPKTRAVEEQKTISAIY